MGRGPKKVSILFVCLGNICRSPLAHCVMNHYIKEGIDAKELFDRVDSCGMYGEPEGQPTHYGTQNILQKQLGIKFTKKSRHWRKSDYNDFDLILAMDASNYADLQREVSSDAMKKIRMFRDFDPQGKGDVPDPYYSGGFGEVFEIVNRTVQNIIQLQRSGKLLE